MPEIDVNVNPKVTVLIETLTDEQKLKIMEEKKKKEQKEKEEKEEE